MPTPEQVAARAAIRDLERNEKHTKADPIAAAQTVPDALDDPKHNRETPADPRWKKAKQKHGLGGRVLSALRIQPALEEVWIDPDADEEN
jgi:hypothetical protein